MGKPSRRWKQMEGTSNIHQSYHLKIRSYMFIQNSTFLFFWMRCSILFLKVRWCFIFPVLFMSADELLRFSPAPGGRVKLLDGPSFRVVEAHEAMHSRAAEVATRLRDLDVKSKNEQHDNWGWQIFQNWSHVLSERTGGFLGMMLRTYILQILRTWHMNNSWINHAFLLVATVANTAAEERRQSRKRIGRNLADQCCDFDLISTIAYYRLLSWFDGPNRNQLGSHRCQDIISFSRPLVF